MKIKKVVLSIASWAGTKREKLNISWPKIILAIALFATAAGALFSTKTLTDVNKNIALAKEAARPANVKIIKITDSTCQDCFDVDTAVTDFKKQNVKVEEEKIYSFDSLEGSSLVEQFAIKKIPTYIVSGEITKSNLEAFIKNNGEITNNSFILTKVTPVFINTENKQEVGKVAATIITDPSCTQCVDPKLTIEGLKKADVKITNQKEVAWNSPEGQKFINQYKITKIPSLLLSSDIDFYDNVKSNWAGIGSVEQDKTYVVRNLPLPYRDLEKNQILGLVDLIYLTDLSCSDCYKVDAVQKPILKQGYGVGIRSERTVDIASGEGKSLIGKYNITKVPTILLSPEVEQYSNLKDVWKTVGTVESDGWYIFREMQQLQRSIYRDLTTNQIIDNAAATPESSETK
ncbi:hypothetical protein A2982_00830 [candidate division WWE3 bacterium RIFCSPLOWO2_01_FULL_39_13]|uniref:Thioredoxin-like fold domain-containing protein n=1 Tax=candidate division WWE3 bacterium RIFCSPLOWO2_01_FULL_39_13 TaxID=1802624 RepID=A0A1F4V5G7_UNCKA|nr:MAG: hypothetical protein A2982_00830 [candidate division WWE3 bacterium RIFCSPLOWO2_01_FULL_39_13]